MELQSVCKIMNVIPCLHAHIIIIIFVLVIIYGPVLNLKYMYKFEDTRLPPFELDIKKPYTLCA